MRLETGYEERRARIEMVPLMDVVFLLLVFFIYAMFTMTTQRGVRVNLPAGVGVPPETDPLVVVMRADSRLQLEGVDMSRERLIAETVRRQREEGRSVLISADREAPLGSGIELLDALRRSGISTVAFQVRPEPEP